MSAEEYLPILKEKLVEMQSKEKPEPTDYMEIITGYCMHFFAGKKKATKERATKPAKEEVKT